MSIATASGVSRSGVRLSSAALDALPAEVAVPSYDRSLVTAGIVHLGLGAFHRAHQAVFIDDCVGRGEVGWGIVAASLRNPDTRDAITPQDNLYTFCLRDGGTETLRVIGSILETIVAPENPERLLDCLSDPAVRIVTLTVTEKGYLANLAAGTLLLDHPDIGHDLAHPGRPRSIYGFLLEAIRRRRAAGTLPLTLLSCDNLPSNGRMLHRLLAAFADLSDPELAAFVRSDVSCPCVMVDRIVPATTDEDRETISAALGVTDAWPVVAEPYFRWVIEDKFRHGRPALELSGAEFVADVEPYEHMKLRLLNGAHTAIAAIGQITGLETVAEAYANPRVRRYIDLYWTQVVTTVDPVVGAADYVAHLRQRFANPALRHRCVQIASDASQKLPQRLLAPLRDLLAQGRDPSALVLAVALWIRSCARLNEEGGPITIHDPAFHQWNDADHKDRNAAATVERFLHFRQVFDPASGRQAGIAAALTAALDEISQHGALGAIERLADKREE